MSERGRFTSVDMLHVVVLGALVLLSPLAVLRTDAGWWLTAGYLVLLLLVVGLALAEGAWPESRLISFAHLWHPAPVVLLVFWSMYYVVPAVNPGGFRDQMLIAWDRALLGFDPIAWHQTIEHPVLTDVMHLIYISYFFLPVALIVWLLVLKREAAFRESIFVMVLSFYLCYVGYAMVPARGPRYEVFGHNQMDGWLVTQPLRDAIDALEPSKMDAFPSAHAAATLVVMWLALRHSPRLGRALAVLTVLILLSLVYTRYHYVIDVIAGGVWALVSVPLGTWLHRRWERRRLGPPDVAGGVAG